MWRSLCDCCMNYVNNLFLDRNENISTHNISTGGKQRINLARAIIRNRPIMLLDEFNSNLDQDTEEEILTILERMKGEKIIIAVNHKTKFKITD